VSCEIGKTTLLDGSDSAEYCVSIGPGTAAPASQQSSAVLFASLPATSVLGFLVLFFGCLPGVKRYVWRRDEYTSVYLLSEKLKRNTRFPGAEQPFIDQCRRLFDEIRRLAIFDSCPTIPGPPASADIINSIVDAIQLSGVPRRSAVMFSFQWINCRYPCATSDRVRCCGRRCKNCFARWAKEEYDPLDTYSANIIEILTNSTSSSAQLLRPGSGTGAALSLSKLTSTSSETEMIALKH